MLHVIKDRTGGIKVKGGAQKEVLLYVGQSLDVLLEIVLLCLIDLYISK